MISESKHYHKVIAVMKVYILTFSPYDAGDRIIDVYTEEGAAEKRIQACIEDDRRYNPGFPARYEQRADRYSVEEKEVVPAPEPAVKNPEWPTFSVCVKEKGRNTYTFRAPSLEEAQAMADSGDFWDADDLKLVDEDTLDSEVTGSVEQED